MLHGPEDEAALRKAGLRWTVKVGDLVAQDRAAARASAARAAAPPRRAGLGAAERPHQLPHAGRLQRRAQGPRGQEPEPREALHDAREDLRRQGRARHRDHRERQPQRRQAGVLQHGRPPRPRVAGRRAHDGVGDRAGQRLQEGRGARDERREQQRATSSCRSSTRTASRPRAPPARSPARAAAATRPSTTPPTSSRARRPAASTGARTAACPTTPRPATAPPSLGLAENGVDPNRNYGGLWGGPGADTNPLTQTYRGPGPFSEPETRNVKSVVSRNQVMTLITNHTTAGLVLRAPGLAMLGDPVDENRGYKALGDAMAKENGYFSQKSFELYDTTGTTEDWSYNATGGFGFTFELYCGAPNYATGDCDDPAFHPRYQRVVEEWDGTNPMADHTNDPGPNKGYDGKGNREAYYIAAESAINEQRHSVLEASVPPGTTLRLTKDFKTQTFPQPQSDGTREADRDRRPPRDDLRRRRAAGSAGTSTRRRGRSWPRRPARPDPGPPSPPETRNGGPAGAADDPQNDGAAPGGDAERQQPAQLQRPSDHRPVRRRQRDDAGEGRVGDADERLRRQALRGHQRRRPLAGLRAGRRHEPERRDQRGDGLRLATGPGRPARSTCCG